MRLIPSPEQEELRDSVRAFLQLKSSEPDVRRVMSSSDGVDRDIWKQMAVQLGLQGLAIPERFGGSGYGFGELAIVAEEMGRALYVGPFFSSALLATEVLMASGDEGAMARWLPQLASGEAIATVALAPSLGLYRRGGDLSVTNAGTSARIDGQVSFVSDGALADIVLVAYRDERGDSVAVVDAREQPIGRYALENIDPTRRFSELTFNQVPALLLGEPGSAGQWFAGAMDRAITALAVECVGGAQRCLEMATDYAQQRFTFGRAIGSYQAIKHKCADMKIAVDAAATAAAWAVYEASAAGAELSSAAAVAKSYCAKSYFSVAGDNIQIHGGLGFTWECPAHLYFKRAKASELFLGSSASYRERLNRQLTVAYRAEA